MQEFGLLALKHNIKIHQAGWNPTDTDWSSKVWLQAIRTPYCSFVHLCPSFIGLRAAAAVGPYEVLSHGRVSQHIFFSHFYLQRPAQIRSGCSFAVLWTREVSCEARFRPAVACKSPVELCRTWTNRAGFQRLLCLIWFATQLM